MEDEKGGGSNATAALVSVRLPKKPPAMPGLSMSKKGRSVTRDHRAAEAIVDPRSDHIDVLTDRIEKRRCIRFLPFGIQPRAWRCAEGTGAEVGLTILTRRAHVVLSSLPNLQLDS